MKKVYLITNIRDFGMFISFCIENDISVWRTYWDEREAGDRCFHIDWNERRCYYTRRRYYEEEGYEIVEPYFILDQWGRYILRDGGKAEGGRQ